MHLDLVLVLDDLPLYLVIEEIDGRIEVRGLGTFEVRKYLPYAGRNPKTGKRIEVKPKKLPFFKVGKELKERVDFK